MEVTGNEDTCCKLVLGLRPDVVIMHVSIERRIFASKTGP